MLVVKNGLKNFFKNLKYFFVPLGTLFLGIIIGLSISLPLLQATLTDFINDVSSLSIAIDTNAFIDSVWSSINNLDWSNTVDSLSQLFSRNFLESTINNSLSSLIPNYNDYVISISSFVDAAITNTITDLAVIIVFVILGFVGGFFLTKSLIRKQIANRHFYQFIIVTIVDIILSGGLMSLCIYLFSLRKFSSLASTLLSYILIALISLYEAYLIHGRNKIRPKQVVNLKNSSRLIISDISIIIVAWLFSGIFTVFFNQLAGIVIGFTFMEIANIVINMNAESYVIELVNNLKSKEDDEGKNKGKRTKQKNQ